LHAGSQLKVKHVTLDEVDPNAFVRPVSIGTTVGPDGEAEEAEEVEEREAPTVVSVDKEPQGQLLLVKLSKDLVPGFSYRLGAEFSGHINNKSSEGLFKGCVFACENLNITCVRTI
jgi:hypothetical protein